MLACRLLKENTHLVAAITLKKYYAYNTLYTCLLQPYIWTENAWEYFLYCFLLFVLRLSDFEGGTSNLNIFNVVHRWDVWILEAMFPLAPL